MGRLRASIACSKPCVRKSESLSPNPGSMTMRQRECLSPEDAARVEVVSSGTGAGKRRAHPPRKTAPRRARESRVRDGVATAQSHHAVNVKSESIDLRARAVGAEAREVEMEV